MSYTSFMSSSQNPCLIIVHGSVINVYAAELSWILDCRLVWRFWRSSTSYTCHKARYCLNLANGSNSSTDCHEVGIWKGSEAFETAVRQDISSNWMTVRQIIFLLWFLVTMVVVRTVALKHLFMRTHIAHSHQWLTCS